MTVVVPPVKINVLPSRERSLAPIVVSVEIVSPTTTAIVERASEKLPAKSQARARIDTVAPSAAPGGIAYEAE